MPNALAAICRRADRRRLLRTYYIGLDTQRVVLPA